MSADEMMVPYRLVPTFAYEAQHAFIDSLSTADEIEETMRGIDLDFAAVFYHRSEIAADLLTVLETVASRDCYGCKDVANRIALLISDLKAEVGAG